MSTFCASRSIKYLKIQIPWRTRSFSAPGFLLFFSCSCCSRVGLGNLLNHCHHRRCSLMSIEHVIYINILKASLPLVLFSTSCDSCSFFLKKKNLVAGSCPVKDNVYLLIKYYHTSLALATLKCDGGNLALWTFMAFWSYIVHKRNTVRIQGPFPLFHMPVSLSGPGVSPSDEGRAPLLLAGFFGYSKYFHGTLKAAARGISLGSKLCALNDSLFLLGWTVMLLD